MTTRRALVLGGGDVGSAVAHRLFQLGWQVLVSERERSPHARRGMAFTDAIFEGRATLAGVMAQLQPDLQAVEESWRHAVSIPVVVVPEAEIFSTLQFDVVIEATMRRHEAPPDMRAVAPLVIGLGPGYVPGHNCHVAVETQWGESMGKLLREQPTAARRGGPQPLGGIGGERFAIASASGAWHTECRLGQPVRAGEEIGRVGEQAVRAPISGFLRGLARDGVAVSAGRRLAEVDPRAEPDVFGLGERPRAIANGVVEALGLSFDAAGQVS
jgi:xanthine dehydrogenase accessory factor